MRIICVGVNHRTAPLAVREKLAFDAAGARRALDDLRKRWPRGEFMIVSTCNRTEIYSARPVHGHPRTEQLRGWLADFHAIDPRQLADAAYCLADADAAAHLFAVASGLDSLVPGEDQIVGQLKEAFAAAVEAGAARAAIGELVQTALHTAKHVRSETGIALGKVSVASVAIEFVRRIYETLDGKVVLSVGAGRTGELMLQHLEKPGGPEILIANRSGDRAETLARKVGGTAVPFGDLGEHLVRADVVLCSTGSSEPVITREMVRGAQRRRNFRPLLIVDVAVPRDVAADAGEIENVFLYNIDDLEKIVDETLAKRKGHRAAADAIIAEHVDELRHWLNIRGVAPTIDALYRRLEAIAAEELREARNKLAAHDDADADEEILRRTLHRTIRRILHPLAAHLRKRAAGDDARAHVAAIRELFDLDEDRNDEKTDS